MGVGILEPRRRVAGHQVPGTVILLKETDEAQVTLNPQPSESPRDPLLWSPQKKFLTLLTISLGCLGVGLQGISLSAATEPITKELHLTLAQTESLTSYPFLSTAVSCAISAVISRIIGKRPLYLIAGICALAGAVWTALTTSYGSFVAARLVYGLGSGVFESMPVSTIGDIFFVHQRGRSTAFFSFICLGFTQLSPVLGGFMTDQYGWRSQFWAITAFWAIMMFFLFFANPETTFYREPKLETDFALATGSEDSAVQGTSTKQEINSSKSTETPSGTESPMRTETRQTYLESLMPFQRIQNRSSLLSAVLRFALVGLYPLVWITFLLMGTFHAWWIGTSLSLAQIFAGPPTMFDPTRLGFLNAFGIVGALGAEIMLHALSDSSCKRLAQRNNHIHEPEYRLVMILPAVAVTVLAFPLFGWYGGTIAATHEISWVAAAVLFGLVLFTLVNGQSVALSYVLDAHREISVEAVMFVIMLRSFWTYGAGTFLPLWIEHSGVADSFYEIAGLQAGLILSLAAVTYVFGKRIRDFTARHSPMERWLHT